MDALALWRDQTIPDTGIPVIAISSPGDEQARKLFTIVPAEFFLECPHTWEAVAVLLLVCYLKGIHKTEKDLCLTSHFRKRWGLSRITTYRGLEQLERAGLIRVVRQKGKSPTVSILSVLENPRAVNRDLTAPVPAPTMAKLPHICEHCGKVFFARKGAKYCSSLCRWHGFKNRKRAQAGVA